MLNFSKEQEQAVRERDRDIIVSASAGSGKTTVMIERVMSLLEEGYDLEQMLIVTFTNASKKDMKEKLAFKLFQSKNEKIKGQLNKLAFLDISTLHSFCQKIIKSYFYVFNIDPEFSVLEDYEREPLLNQAIKAVLEEEYIQGNEDYFELTQIYADSNQDYRLINLIIDLLNASELNNSNLDIDYSNKYLNALKRIVDKVEKVFFKLKQAKSKLDFFDLEKLALKILNSPLKEQIQKKYKFIFVDEYQDINPLQNQIIDSLKNKDNNLFLVGDLKQSIYAFRGCEPSIFVQKFLEFKQNKDCLALSLNDNYRSCNEILTFCNEVFSLAMTNEFGSTDYKNDGTFNIKGESGQGVRIHFCPKKEQPLPEYYDIKNAKSQESVQAQRAALCILDILANESITENGKTRPVMYKDIAVLFRSVSGTVYSLASILESKLIKTTLSIKSNKSVDTLINLLKVINNSLSDESLINSLLSVFGSFTEEDLAKIREFTPKTDYFYEAVNNYIKLNEDELKNRLDRFYLCINEYRELSNHVSVSELVGRIVSDFEYFQHLFAHNSAEASRLEGFLDSLKNYNSLYELLNSNLNYKAEEAESDAINIMTVHSAKGLEFPYVLILNAQKRFNLLDLYNPVLVYKNKAAIKDYDIENRVVSDSEEWLLNQSLLSKRQKEEELRLLYVALTRAKKRVDIFIEAEQKEKTEFKQAIEAISWLDWLYPFVNKYAVNEYNNICILQKKQVIYPSFSQSLVDKLRQRFNESKEIVQKKPKSYVTALINDTEESIEKSDIIFNSDDRALIKGNMYHKAMELISFFDDFDISYNLLDEEIKKEINKEDIINCIDKIKPLLKGNKYYKEQPFMLNLDSMLIQGVIDLLIIDENREAIIIDYKTGNISLNYKKQIDYYALAVEKILNISVKQRYIYSFKTNELIDI